MLRSVNRCIHSDRPVQLTLMAFPFKVPNRAKVGSRRLPDLAELAALVRFHALNSKVKSIYPPGLEIHIIHDGSYIAGVFGVAIEEVRRYEEYFGRLVRALGADRFLRLHDLERLWASCADLARSRPTRHDTTRVAWTVKREWTNRFCKTLGMMNLRNLPMEEVCRLLDCASVGYLPPEYGELEQSVRAAMLRYWECDSILHTRDPRPVCFPDAVHVTTQCRPGRLAIWLVNRGNSLLPWHGVGVIRRKGEWSVALARDVVRNSSYQPVFLEGEDTPFFYREVSDDARKSRSVSRHCSAND